MKNSYKLIFANIFAMISITTILTVSKMMGYEVGLYASSFIPNLLLISVPQFGFIYLYSNSNTKADSKYSG
ncbi:hypothetical protein EL17_00215 [Anditalea andensis]|uniref:Uncharacterized protein n=1 Tax=Anditalea andensis TaxID=1048983 RepID=A0A074LNQ7_9BACT|nr:hypothetical protein EL17_00215 [Anditalea andensis]